MTWAEYIASSRRRRYQQPIALISIDVWSPDGRRAVTLIAPWGF